MQFNWLSHAVASLRNTSAVAVSAAVAAATTAAAQAADWWKEHSDWDRYAARLRKAVHDADDEHGGSLRAWLSPRALTSQVLAIAAEALEHIVYACLVYLLVCLAVYFVRFVRSTAIAAAVVVDTPPRASSSLADGDASDGAVAAAALTPPVARPTRKNVRLPKWVTLGRVLFVTSHPDDECMFFGPLIYSLTQRSDCQVYLLCLSNGNYEKKSQQRREELWRSCQQLGVPASNVILMNATNLPDDPNTEWRTEPVANIILHTVESLDIQALVTFDRDGVSQHPNHCAVYYAGASLCLAKLLPKDCKFYALDSINVLRKYLSVFDTLCTLFMSTHWCILSLQQAAVIRRAMREHRSQMKWFRWLYIYFSRYMFINSVREVTLSDVELEMQIHDH